MENELLACFLLGEKNNATPAPTKVLLSEKTIQEVRQQLNDTLKTQKIDVSVLTDDLKPVVSLKQREISKVLFVDRLG